MPESSNSGASFSEFVAQRMADESEFETIEGVAPIRPTGVVAFLLSLFSPACYFGWGMIWAPVASVLFGLFAIRSYTGERPGGITLGKIGILISVLFGMVGGTVHTMRRQTLTSQAEQFAMQFLSTVARGENEIALQLSQPYMARSKAPLRQLYLTPDGQKALETFLTNGITKPVQDDIGDDPDWRVSRPTRLWRGPVNTGSEKAVVCLMDRRGRTNAEAQIGLSLLKDPVDGTLQWHIDYFQNYRERLVSPGKS
ncbi:MAG: hypothetical protein AAF958_19590 [Planctomycetota bacterium]